jgi:hypothetical protein
MKFDIPKKWFADRIEQFGEDGDCTVGNPNFKKELDDLEDVGNNPADDARSKKSGAS